MRRKLSKADQLRGVTKAIRAIERKKVAPKWLLPGMRRVLDRLESEIRQGMK